MDKDRIYMLETAAGLCRDAGCEATAAAVEGAIAEIERLEGVVAKAREILGVGAEG